jgi:hypothetical protein
MRAVGHMISTPAKQLLVIRQVIWSLLRTRTLSNQRPFDLQTYALTNCATRANWNAGSSLTTIVWHARTCEAKCFIGSTVQTFCQGVCECKTPTPFRSGMQESGLSGTAGISPYNFNMTLKNLAWGYRYRQPRSNSGNSDFCIPPQVMFSYQCSILCLSTCCLQT